MKIFVSMKVPRGNAELEKQVVLLTEVIRQFGNEPFVATDEIAERGWTDPQMFMPFVRQHIEASDLMIVLYHLELRGGLIEMGIAYANNIPIWLCHKTGKKVSSSARGCAELTVEYSDLAGLQETLSANLRKFSQN